MPSTTTQLAPEGLIYRPDFISVAEERMLLAHLETLEYGHLVLHGVPSKREVYSFGWRYSFESNELQPAPPIVDRLVWLRDRCAQLADEPAARLAQALVNRYPRGSGIGYHRDLYVFGEKVVGVSLLAACPMRFQRTTAGSREVYVAHLAPRSAYVLRGPARYQWEHGITSCPELRYSLTFRTLKGESH